MWMMMGIFSLMLVIIGADFPIIKDLVKQKKKKDLFIYAIFLFMGISLVILISINITIPNPLEFLQVLYRPFFTLLGK